MKYLSQIIAIMFVLILIFANIPTTANQNIKDQHSEASYDLLIISPKIFSKHLTPLVCHKNSHGVKTKLVTVEDVYDQMFWQGRDQAEKIKYFIKNAHETWDIKYVLLVGGRKDQSLEESWWIPVRYSYLERNYGTWPEGKFLSDLYFADIYDKNGNFSSWDTNNNGIYGEWSENDSAVDIPNLYPDIYVGRLPCRNILDVKIIVNKIIGYETGDFSDDWFKNMVVVAGDTYPDKTPGFIDGEAHAQKAIDFMNDFEPRKLWASDGSLKNWVDIVREINRGCGFVFFSGHGSPHQWDTYYPNDNKSRMGTFKLKHMAFLSNIHKLPVCVSASGCFNNMFNVSLGHSEWVYWRNELLDKIGEKLDKIFAFPYNIPRCWGAGLTLKPYGGCIAVIASTAFSYESSDIDSKNGGCEWLDITFFEQYGVNNVDILGECWGKSVTSFLQNFTINWSNTSSTGDALIAKNVEQWLLIGDPSLKIGGYN